MKKLFIGVLIALITLSAVSVPALAGSSTTGNTTGPYEGVFRGYIYGDKGSRALLTLNLSHEDGVISGTASLGEGLYVSAGRCGGGRLPTAVQAIYGKTLENNPYKVQAGTQFNVSGFKIGVNLNSELSKDGDVIDAQAKIDIPWICGSDPVISGELYRVN